MAVSRGGLNAAKVMKPPGELNRSVRVACKWVLLACTAGADSPGPGLVPDLPGLRPSTASTLAVRRRAHRVLKSRRGLPCVVGNGCLQGEDRPRRCPVVTTARAFPVGGARSHELSGECGASHCSRARIPTPQRGQRRQSGTVRAASRACVARRSGSSDEHDVASSWRQRSSWRRR
jgi:hypothetical protein